MDHWRIEYLEGADFGDEILSGWAIVSDETTAHGETVGVWSPVFTTQAEAGLWLARRRYMEQAPEPVAELLDYLGQQIAELTGAVDRLAQGMYWQAHVAGQLDNAADYRTVQAMTRDIRAATYVLRRPTMRELEGAGSRETGEQDAGGR